MVAVGFGAIWVGGLVFNLLVALACGAMVWELSRMIDPKSADKALQMGLMTSAMLLICAYISPFYMLPFLLAPGLTGAARMPRMGGVYLGFAFVIALAGISLISVRGNLGFGWILWLICVVVVTDVAGYFAGKMLGGPKLWPRVSPKKTWSGTLAGWVGAGIVGALFSTLAGAGTALIVISVLMSMTSQAGDIAESALKRRTGVKDSSALIPGHGGVMDRFDGMLGAALFVLLAAALFGFPVGLV
jgi:phosphatidate cytidylyltransferase